MSEIATDEANDLLHLGKKVALSLPKFGFFPNKTDIQEAADKVGIPRADAWRAFRYLVEHWY